MLALSSLFSPRYLTKKQLNKTFNRALVHDLNLPLMRMRLHEY